MVNIFAPHRDPVKSASTLDKKRLSRMCFESYEVLSAVIQKQSSTIRELKPFAKKVYTPSAGHANHPVVHWVLKDTAHFEWLLEHAQALNTAYMDAYNKQQPCAPFTKIDAYAQQTVPYLPRTTYKDTPIEFEGFFNFNQFRRDQRTQYDGTVVLRNSISIHTRYKLYLLHKWLYLDKRLTEWATHPPAWAFKSLYHDWLKKHFGAPVNTIPQLNSSKEFVIPVRQSNKPQLSLRKIGIKIADRINGYATFNDDNGVESTAIFENKKNQLYRYFLSRQWGQLPPLIVIMLNPSTADAFKNDPTVQLIENLAKSMGFGGYIVLNVAAYRATEPADMLKQKDPIGQHNLDVISWTVRAVINRWVITPAILLAYGNNVDKLPNGKQHVLSIIDTCKDIGNLLCLEITKRNHPRHPLYFDTSKVPQRYLPW